MNKLKLMRYGLWAEAGEGGGETTVTTPPPEVTQTETQGALTAKPAETATPPAEPPPTDWTKATDEEYFKDFKAPEGFDRDSIARDYGKFLRENNIPPSVLSKYLELEGGLRKAADAARTAEEEKAAKADREAFAKEGEAVRKEFSPEQINSAVEALADLGKTDKAFYDMAVGRMSNNPTLVRLLVNWRDTHKGDSVSGAGAGGGSQATDFATLWKGHR